MDRIVEIAARLERGRIVGPFDPAAVATEVVQNKKIVLLKNVFPAAMLGDIRQALVAWGRRTEPAAADEFRGNYHRRRAMVSRLQQAPHVFHDYNFNDLAGLPPELNARLLGLFDPLRLFYNALTAHATEFAVPSAGPYVHPQIIHYPSGGGFFGRHWHNLMPQTLGFIVSLSRRGEDYRTGGTVFDIDGDIVEMAGRHDLGDICIWRYDYHHWVTQSDLSEKFDWESEDGRWVATFAYFDPYAA